MNRLQTILDLFWVVAGASLAWYATVRLGVFESNDPGSGFMPLVSGCMLLTIGLFRLAVSLITAGSETDVPFWPDWVAPRRVLSVVAGIAAIIVLMEPLGFLVITPLVMMFLLRLIEPLRWPYVVALAFGSSIAMWQLFRSMNVLLPSGMLSI